MGHKTVTCVSFASLSQILSHRSSFIWISAKSRDCGRGVVSDSAAMEGWSGKLTGLPRENKGDR